MKTTKGRPAIRKMGTVDRDVGEVTPLVIGGRLYRFEYIHEDYYLNDTGNSYFRFVDVRTGQCTPAFAQGCHYGSAHCQDGVVYAFGVYKDASTLVRDASNPDVGSPVPGSETMKVFRSADLAHWEEKTAFHLPGWEIFNNSVCRGRDGYVMAIEIRNPPEECGVPFTCRFALSADLWNWTMTPSECVFAKDRYTACPTIRYLPQDGFYYMIYLEALPGWCFAPYIARTKDLVRWQLSPVNPVMTFDDAEDKKLAHPSFSPEEQRRIAGALNCNNSDVDLCEYNGRTILYYGWSNQNGVGYLAEAAYEGPLAEYLQGFFEEWEVGAPL